ncbi:hypothetical protein [Thermogutta sp.]|jgi:hypothetical protein
MRERPEAQKLRKIGSRLEKKIPGKCLTTVIITVTINGGTGIDVTGIGTA